MVRGLIRAARCRAALASGRPPGMRRLPPAAGLLVAWGAVLAATAWGQVGDIPPARDANPRSAGATGSTTEPRATAPELVDLLFNPRAPLAPRLRALETLEKAGTSDPQVMPALIRMLQLGPLTPEGDPDARQLRERGLRALAALGPEAELAAPLLMRMVRDPRESESFRRLAIEALGALQGKGAIAIGALCEALEFDASPEARVAAAEALARIGEPAVASMSAYLRHRDSALRGRIAASLGLLSSEAAQAQTRGPLLDALRDPDETVRLHAAESAWKLYRAAAPEADTAIPLLASDQRPTRFRAMRLVVDLPQLEARHVQALEALRDHPRSEVRKIAAKTLQRANRQEPGTSQGPVPPGTGPG